MPKDQQKSELAKLLQGFSREYPRTRWVTPVEGMPPIKEPPPLGMTPYIQGPDTARYMEQIRSLNPRIMEQLGNITTGPNYSKIEDLLVYQDNKQEFLGKGFNPFPRSTNLGIFDKRRGRSIYLNPHMRGRQLFTTLAHELGHAAGANEESADKIDEAADSFFTDNLPTTPVVAYERDASRARRTGRRYQAAERERRRRLRIKKARNRQAK